MGNLAVGARGTPVAPSSLGHEDTISRTTREASRGGQLGTTAVDDYPLESLVYWLMTHQRKPTRARAASLRALTGPIASPEELWVAPPLSPQSHTALSSISSLDLPFFKNQCGPATPDTGSRLHSSHDYTIAAPNTNNTAVVAVNALPLFNTFFSASSASSLGSFSTINGREPQLQPEPEPETQSDPEPDIERGHECDFDYPDDACDSDTGSLPSSIVTETTMPGPTLAAPVSDGAAHSSSTDYFADFSFDTATSLTGPWRPQSAKSARSARSSSPLFARWARRHHPHHLDLPTDGREAAEKKSSNKAAKKNANKEDGLTRTTSINKRPLGTSPQLTREEFEALPLAIQRKYFSTLERLRFAQESGAVDGISEHYNNISAQNAKRRKAHQDRSASHSVGGRIRRKSLREANLSSPASRQLATFPDKIKRSHFTREEQVFLARQLRASVILDAADEAVYKLGRRASKHLAPAVKVLSPTVSSRRNSMEPEKRDKPAPGPESFYDSFRWLDEEDDLDLRLFLDDYHANLREEVPSPTKERRPSFRRHLSITKIPFGRSSVSSSRPATKDATSPMQTSPNESPVGISSSTFGHGRRKSRALSLITPRHSGQDSITAFDPAAAHYQDPEARLKLRVYLASPQKFDEAIEFGFPSTDVLSASPVITKNTRLLNHRQSRQKLSDDPSMRTFLADEDDDDDDDKSSVNSDQPSLADPDSPRTPQYFENKPAVRPVRVSTENHASKLSDGGYTQVPASSREMTLRMTLTRPDLRANEDQMYGWQGKGAQPGRKSLSSPVAMDQHPVTYVGDGQHKESIERVFAGIDHWNATQPTDGSVMKRIWNRVRRS